MYLIRKFLPIKDSSGWTEPPKTGQRLFDRLNNERNNVFCKKNIVQIKETKNSIYLTKKFIVLTVIAFSQLQKVQLCSHRFLLCVFY